MAVEIVIGIALAALVAGVAGGFFLGKGRGNSEKVKELEGALARSQTELSDYRGEVFSQFAETAEKFKALDASYQDLHRQLAASSVALCGDDATPLLPGPERDLLTARANETWEEKQVEDAADAAMEDGSEETIEDTVETAERAAEETAAGTEAPTPQTTATGANDSRRHAEKDDEEKAAQNLAGKDDGKGDGKDKSDDKDDILVSESTDVPVLTDVEKEQTAAERTDDEDTERKSDSRQSAP